MARRSGMMTALQAALAGVAGGIEGRVQQREADEEKSRITAALARQKEMDAFAKEDRTFAKEDREYAKEDRLRSQRLAVLKGGYVPEGLDMPGATPRTPVNTETVGGTRYSTYETPQQMARREAVEEKLLEAKFTSKPSMTPYQMRQDARAERRLQLAEDNASKDAADKTAKVNISKVLAGAGKIVAASRAEEKQAEAQLARLERSRPDLDDPKFTGTQEEFDAAEAAWQSKMDAAEKRLEAAQAKTYRIAPVYEGSLTTFDTTGYGQAFPAVAKAPTYNTKEAALMSSAQRKIAEVQSSDLSPEEKQQKVQQVNSILAREVAKLRGQER